MTTSPSSVTAADVAAAFERLRTVATNTPVLTSRSLDERVGASVFLKADHLQRGGAFKFRGAYNTLAQLSDEERARGVVGFSSGNHAAAMAYAGSLLNICVTVVMPHDAPDVKVHATENYGALVVRYDRFNENRNDIAAAIAAKSGARIIDHVEDPHVIAGQGTAAYELCRDVADLDIVIAPTGTAGLLAGTAVAARALQEHVQVYGAEPAARTAARKAFASGTVVTEPVPHTLCDGMQTTSIGALPLTIIREHLTGIVGVDDTQVSEAVRFLALRMKQVVEPSGAAGLAAVLAGLIDVTDKRVGVILSGGNIAPDVLNRILTAA
jgi:threo-3-hydroxy-L-aspartate ammonia-lyase